MDENPEKESYRFCNSTFVASLNEVIKTKILSGLEKMKNDKENDLFDSVDEEEFEFSKKLLSENLQAILNTSGNKFVARLDKSDIFSVNKILLQKNDDYDKKEDKECDKVIKDLQMKRFLIENMKEGIILLENENNKNGRYS